MSLDDAQRDYCVRRLENTDAAPGQRLGLALRGVARSMLDISDGLAGDLAHIARASGVRAQVHADALPLSPALRGVPRELALQCALGGGDDYELCFAAAPSQRAGVEAAGRAADVAVTRIGSVLPALAGAAPVGFVDAAGRDLSLNLGGYDHFGA